jgi:hypothetical protein
MARLGAGGRVSLAGPPGALAAYEARPGSALHFLRVETVQLCLELALGRGGGSAASQAIVSNNLITSKVMPYMVHHKSQVGGHALTNKCLFYVHQNVTQLENLLTCAASSGNDDAHQLCVSRAMYPDGRLAPALGADVKGVTFAVLSACSAHVALRLGTAGEDTGDVFALAQVTPDEQRSARTWLGEHWNGGVRSVMGTKHGNVMPAFDSEAWWKFVRKLLRRVFGFGLRAPDAAGLRAIVANSFWGDHKVDVGAVIRQHREQTRVARGELEKAATSHQGRAFGHYCE